MTVVTEQIARAEESEENSFSVTFPLFHDYDVHSSLEHHEEQNFFTLLFLFFYYRQFSLLLFVCYRRVQEKERDLFTRNSLCNQ